MQGTIQIPCAIQVSRAFLFLSVSSFLLFNSVPSIVEYVKKWNGMIDKVNYFFDDLEERQEIWELLKQRDDILVSTSLYNNLEINGPGASKGEGLLRLASMLGIRREETMAFGDGNNDASMIRDARWC